MMSFIRDTCYLVHGPSYFLQIASYDGILRYTVSHEMDPGGEMTSETDVQLRVGCVINSVPRNIRELFWQHYFFHPSSTGLLAFRLLTAHRKNRNIFSWKDLSQNLFLIHKHLCDIVYTFFLLL